MGLKDISLVYIVSRVQSSYVCLAGGWHLWELQNCSAIILYLAQCVVRSNYKELLYRILRKRCEFWKVPQTQNTHLCKQRFVVFLLVFVSY